MTRLLAWPLYIALVLLGHALILPLALLRLRDSVRVTRAALLWDLCMARLMGAEPGETVSTWAARVRSGWACAMCRLLSVRWPRHCEDADNVLFNIVRSKRAKE